jgi:hypothetical protein
MNTDRDVFRHQQLHPQISFHQYCVQGRGTSDCKTELCTRHILASPSIDRRAQPQIAVERFAVLDFRGSLADPRLQSDAPRPCRSSEYSVVSGLVWVFC